MASIKRPKVLLLIPHLGGGGAERVMAHLMRYLSPKKYEVHLGLVTQSALEMQCSPQVNAFQGQGLLHAMGAGRVRSAVLKIMWLVWVVRPAVILSGMSHLNLLVLSLRPLLPPHTSLVVRQNGPLAATLAPWRNTHLARRIYAAAYRQADKVISCRIRA